MAQERLRLRSDGRVALELKQAWHDGTRELVFERLLFESDQISSAGQVKDIEEAAKGMGLRVTPIGLRQAADIEPAFQRGAGASERLTPSPLGQPASDEGRAPP